MCRKAVIFGAGERDLTELASTLLMREICHEVVP
jgi:hypothetical protein